MPEYNSNIDALNDVVVDYGLPGGHHFEIDALNAWAVHLGGSGGHQFNIDALNEIIGLVDGSGTFQFEIDAYNEISRVLGGRSDFRFVEDALSEISDLPVFGEGGGGAPEWVPEGAAIYIDLVGGTPQGRAWVDGVGEVAVDTLLGADANTSNAWDVTSAIAPEDYVASGLAPAGNKPAFIGALRDLAIAGATIVAKATMTDIETGNTGTIKFIIMSANGNDAVELDMNGEEDGRTTVASSYSGSLSEEVPNIANGGVVGAKNATAITITATRIEVAVNAGADILAGTLAPDDRPEGNPFVAAMLDWDTAGDALSSITAYAPLASTAGLAALAVTGVTNTGPTNLLSGESNTEFDRGVIESTNGMTVTVLQADDAEGNPLTFTLTDDDGGNFVMSGASVTTTDDLSAGVYNFTARATDPGGLYVEQELTLNVLVAPVISNLTETDVTSNSMSFSFETTRVGELFHYVVTQSATPPTYDQIQGQVNENWEPADFAANGPIDVSPKTLSTGSVLASATSYWLHLVQNSAGQSNNPSNVLTEAFTTDA